MKKLILLPMILVIVLVLSCGGRGTSSQPQTVQIDPAAREAPQLAQMVREGRLPPLEDRLPRNPLVITPYERVGVYGGDWRLAMVGGNLSHMNRYQFYENLVRWSPGWNDIIPNVASRWEISPDSREFTFFFREGMKWSDGTPFTAEDIMFYFEDLITDRTLVPSIPVLFRQGNEVVQVEMIDQFTVKFTFPEPNGVFLFQLAEADGGHIPLPKHYYSKVLPSYNPNAEADARAAGYADRFAWFEALGTTANSDNAIRNGELPRLSAWIWEIPPGEGAASQAIAVRNPYYWKVDTAGNQLPYVDRLVYDLLQDTEVLVLKILNGEIDWMDQYFATASNKPLIYENQQRGGYSLFTTTPTEPNSAVFMFNLNHPDPAMRELFNNRDFRVGISHAINRQEIIDMVYAGWGTPAQVAPLPGTDFYHERLATQYIEYSQDLANAALDRAGLTGRDAQGFRLRPDGARVAFTLQLDVARLEFVNMSELLQSYFRAVGIDMPIVTSDRSLHDQRTRTLYTYDATIHRFGGGAGLSVINDPRNYFPFSGNSFYAPAWALWYNNPQGIGSQIRPEEPPAQVREAMALFDEIRITGSMAEQTRLMQRILDIAADQFYVLGILWEGDGYGVVRNNFINTPPVMPWSYAYPHPGPENPSQFFFDPTIRMPN